MMVSKVDHNSQHFNSSCQYCQYKVTRVTTQIIMTWNPPKIQVIGLSKV